MNWSEQQLEAINIRGKNLLVAAAAGSGKTAVLVERIIRMITDPVSPVDIDRLLVLTFTNAAAAEMRSRIGGALTGLAAGHQSRHIEKQLLLLNSAAISTIHSFCQNVVRQYFYLLDIDPNFRIAGEAETDLLKAEILEGLFEDKYQQADEAFLALVDHYGGERGDDALYSLVLKLYDFSRSHPWPEQWLQELKGRFELLRERDIDATPWSGLIRQGIILELQQALRVAEALQQEALLPGNPEAYAATFAADRTVLDGLVEAAGRSWRSLGAAFAGLEFASLPKTGREVPADRKEYFRKEREKVKNKVKAVQIKLFNRPAENYLADMRSVAPLIDTLAGLVVAFSALYRQKKLAKGLIDFNDLEHYCLQILLAPGARPYEILPSPVARQLQEKYAEIMIDEYQDTNGVQETILQLVAHPEKPNRFMVGDVKQSIYRFRLAEPGLFMDKYYRYSDLTEGTCRRILLSQNFRSRAAVLHAVNFLFSQLMTPAVAELEYGAAEQLNPGPDYPQADCLLAAGPAELHIIDKDAGDAPPEQEESDDSEDSEESGTGAIKQLIGFEQEARLVARRIKELKDSGCAVYDKELKDYRPLCWRDVVILLRSVRGKAALMLETLREFDIPAYAELDSGYFAETEVKVVLSLLNIIDNPRQDIHLAGVLRSPLAGFTARELADVRLADRQSDLWEALNRYAVSGPDQALRQKAAGFRELLAGWRSLSRRKGVAELIWHIYRTTGYYDYVGGMPGGNVRQANLRAMYDRARQYEATNYRGLFRFLRFIERMRDRGSDLSVARALGESEDVVRIMSIHKSKGLEFPVVIIADLGKEINLQDSKALVLCHKDLGVGPYVINANLGFRYPTLARHGIEHKIRLETMAEELRILYVAMTRAREKLILTGSVKKLAQAAAGWQRDGACSGRALPDSLIARARTYLDWICPAIMRHPDGRSLVDKAGCRQEPAGQLRLDPSQWRVEIHRGGSGSPTAMPKPADNIILEKIRRLEPVEYGQGSWQPENTLGWRYPYSRLTGKPAKLSVTEIKRRFDAADNAARTLQTVVPADSLRPQFVRSAGKMTAAEYGATMHTIMQNLNIHGDLSIAGIGRQVEDMVGREMLLPDQAQAADLEGIAAFFNAELGVRLKTAAWVKREIPFSLMLPAARYYPELEDLEEEVFIQGVIDCLFAEQDGLVLIDYKTDHVRNSRELVGKYTVQLELYEEAVGKILGKPVKEKYLYVFAAKEAVKV